jgi:glycerol-3-phosphate dehydrogenase (NAD(P)+)
LITRGLAEIARLGVALGAKALTFAGLTGIGDLIVTCSSMHSRNRRAGILLGQGLRLNEVLQEIGMVVEGIKTTKVALELANKAKVEMPITQEVYRVLFESKEPKQSVNDLMGRQKTHEVEEVVNNIIEYSHKQVI